MTLKSDLENFLGQENVSSETEIIKKYSCDQSFVQPRSPDIVAFPQNVEQVQEIVKYANSTNTPVCRSAPVLIFTVRQYLKRAAS